MGYKFDRTNSHCDKTAYRNSIVVSTPGEVCDTGSGEDWRRDAGVIQSRPARTGKQPGY